MALPESGLTPELYAHCQEELKKAHDANGRLAEANCALMLARDKAEAKFMKTRDDMEDLEEEVATAQQQTGAIRTKYLEATAKLRRRLAYEVVGFIALLAIHFALIAIFP